MNRKPIKCRFCAWAVPAWPSEKAFALLRDHICSDAALLIYGEDDGSPSIEDDHSIFDSEGAS